MDTDKMIDDIVEAFCQNKFEEVLEEYRLKNVGVWSIARLLAAIANPKYFSYSKSEGKMIMSLDFISEMNEIKRELRKPLPTSLVILDTKTLPPTNLYALYKTEKVHVVHYGDKALDEQFQSHYLNGKYGSIRVDTDMSGRIFDCYAYE